MFAKKIPKLLQKLKIEEIFKLNLQLLSSKYYFCNDDGNVGGFNKLFYSNNTYFWDISLLSIYCVTYLKVNMNQVQLRMILDKNRVDNI